MNWRLFKDTYRKNFKHNGYYVLTDAFAILSCIDTVLFIILASIFGSQLSVLGISSTILFSFFSFLGSIHHCHRIHICQYTCDRAKDYRIYNDLSTESYCKICGEKHRGHKYSKKDLKNDLERRAKVRSWKFPNGVLTLLFIIYHRMTELVKTIKEVRSIKKDTQRFQLYSVKVEANLITNKLHCIKDKAQRKADDLLRAKEELIEIKQTYTRSKDFIDPDRIALCDKLLPEIEEVYLVLRNQIAEAHEGIQIVVGDTKEFTSVLEADIQLRKIINAHDLIQESKYLIANNRNFLDDFKKKQYALLDRIAANSELTKAQLNTTNEVYDIVGN